MPILFTDRGVISYTSLMAALSMMTLFYPLMGKLIDCMNK
jgi:hypothetical protein